MGNGTYISPKIPTLYTALTTGSDALDPTVYGPGVNPYVVRPGELVQIVVSNSDGIEHPMHLHGHQFQVVARGSGDWDGNEDALPQVPMQRDVVNTPANGHLVIRYQAYNPGVWMCKW
jgi:iron transport multicopper oxidase